MGYLIEKKGKGDADLKWMQRVNYIIATLSG